MFPLDPRKSCVLATFSALLLSACATVEPPTSPATQPLDIRGAIGVVELGPVRLAAENLYGEGTFIEHGGVFSLVDEENPADIGSNAETQLLIHSVARPDLRIIMTSAEGHYRVIARRSAGINDIADLKGKRVGTMITSSSGYFLHLMLQREGLSFDDIELDDIRPYTAITTALLDGSVDAISIWEPHAENAIRQLGDDAFVVPAGDVYREIFNINTTAAALADPDKRARIVEFVKALIEATEATNADPRRAQQLVAVAGDYTVEEIERSWKHHTFLSAFPDDMLDVMVDEEIWLAGYEKREPRSREELARLLDRSVFDEAMAAAAADRPD